MRILIVHSNAAVIGGVERYLRSTIPELTRRGHEVAVLHEYPAGDAAKVSSDDIRTWHLRPQGLGKMAGEIAQWAPSLLYVHHWNSPRIESELIESYPAIWFAHDYSRTCPTGRKCYSLPTVESCSRRAGAACLALHYPRRCGGLNPATVWARFQIQSEQFGLLARYRAVVAASRHMCAEIAKHGVDGTRVHLASLFPPGSSRDSRPPMTRQPRGKLLMVGRLVDVKGCHHLIEALPLASARLAYRLSLTIAGSGPEEERLRTLAASIGADVNFVGWVEGARLDSLMREADLLAMPSLWPEPFGLVGIEAGCVGLPSVAYASGGVLDWLIAGESGEVAPADPPTPAGLADAIVRALAEPSNYQHLRHGAWEMSKRFSIESHMDKLVSIMERVAHDARVCV